MGSVKNMFLEISRNSQESTCASLFFNNFIKKETLAQVFSGEFCEISKNAFSYRTPPVAASVFDTPIKHFFRKYSLQSSMEF